MATRVAAMQQHGHGHHGHGHQHHSDHGHRGHSDHGHGHHSHRHTSHSDHGHHETGDRGSKHPEMNPRGGSADLATEAGECIANCIRRGSVRFGQARRMSGCATQSSIEFTEGSLEEFKKAVRIGTTPSKSTRKVVFCQSTQSTRQPLDPEAQHMVKVVARGVRKAEKRSKKIDPVEARVLAEEKGAAWKQYLGRESMAEKAVMKHNTVISSRGATRRETSRRTWGGGRRWLQGLRSTGMKWVIDPRFSKFMVWWDSISLFALSYTATFTPFEVAFINPFGEPLAVSGDLNIYVVGEGGLEEIPTSDQIDAWFLMNRLLDAIFITDLVLQFFMAYEDGLAWVTNHHKVVAHYLRGWFAIDLISQAPLVVEILRRKGDALSDLSILRVGECRCAP
eukprot:5248372-Prymnesium_polylepis.1